jgi:hypothetical protein
VSVLVAAPDQGIELLTMCSKGGIIDSTDTTWQPLAVPSAAIVACVPALALPSLCVTDCVRLSQEGEDEAVTTVPAPWTATQWL